MTRLRVILLGGPGVGKGTQALRLTEHFNIPQISTGDMLRSAIAARGALGLNAKKIMDAGQLVSDDIIIALVKERLTHDDCNSGFLLDGFPRTLAQAEALTQAGITLDYVIEIKVNEQEIIKRITGRRVHVASGRVYHIDYQPPLHDGVDDITGEKLILRDDDREEIIRKRLHVYHEQTLPLVQYYQVQSRRDALMFSSVDGTGSVDEIFKRILEVLSKEES